MSRYQKRADLAEGVKISLHIAKGVDLAGGICQIAGGDSHILIYSLTGCLQWDTYWSESLRVYSHGATLDVLWVDCVV